MLPWQLVGLAIRIIMGESIFKTPRWSALSNIRILKRLHSGGTRLKWGITKEPFHYKTRNVRSISLMNIRFQDTWQILMECNQFAILLAYPMRYLCLGVTLTWLYMVSYRKSRIKYINTKMHKTVWNETRFHRLHVVTRI